MSKFKTILRNSYIFIILAVVYTPLFFSAIFSFNSPSDKGNLSFNTWNGTTGENWAQLGSSEVVNALLNSVIIGIFVSILVVAISLMTCYALWRQRRKYYKGIVDGVSNIPLINPDIVTAIGLALTFGIFFGALSADSDGMWRAIISHTVVIVPYGITLMYPRSEKFSASMIEASKDLGFGPFRTWWKTYFRFMLPMVFVTIVVTLTLSFDDFIITRTVSNTSTIGTKLYEGKFQGWALALGTILLFVSLSGSIGYTYYKHRKSTKVVKNA